MDKLKLAMLEGLLREAYRQQQQLRKDAAEAIAIAQRCLDNLSRAAMRRIGQVEAERDSAIARAAELEARERELANEVARLADKVDKLKAKNAKLEAQSAELLRRLEAARAKASQQKEGPSA